MFFCLMLKFEMHGSDTFQFSLLIIEIAAPKFSYSYYQVTNEPPVASVKSIGTSIFVSIFISIKQKNEVLCFLEQVNCLWFRYISVSTCGAPSAGNPPSNVRPPQLP